MVKENMRQMVLSAQIYVKAIERLEAIRRLRMDPDCSPHRLRERLDRFVDLEIVPLLDEVFADGLTNEQVVQKFGGCLACGDVNGHGGLPCPTMQPACANECEGCSLSCHDTGNRR